MIYDLGRAFMYNFMSHRPNNNVNAFFEHQTVFPKSCYTKDNHSKLKQNLKGRFGKNFCEFQF